MAAAAGQRAPPDLARPRPPTDRNDIDFPDGRSIGAVCHYATQTTYWVVCRVEEAPAEHPDPLDDPHFRLVDDPADVPVYGTSLALLLDAALDSGGDIAHLETG